MLYVFVEGYDDKRFISKFLNNCNIEIIEYASDKKEKTDNFIKSIKLMPHADYLFFADTDGKNIEETKQYIQSIYTNIDVEKVIVVQYEIESWYYAGLTQANHEKLKFKKYTHDTNYLTKEMFNAKIPKLSDRILYMQQILNCYCIQDARQRNCSINAFFDTIAI